MNRMKEISCRLTAFFGNWKNIVLPVVFCTCTVVVLLNIIGPVTESVSLAANAQGYTAVKDPNTLFQEVSANNGIVDLAQTGGMVKEGELYGTVVVSGTGVNCNLYYGDDQDQLKAGAGTYMGTQIPGQKGVTLIGAHTGTYFRDLESAQLGANITITTRYGEYHYTITDMQVVLAEEFGMDDLEGLPEESLLLYTCYPFGQLTITPYRYVVYAEYVSGPTVIDSTEGTNEME